MNYHANCGPLELVGRDGSDDGASLARERNPVKRILGRILAIAPQTTPAKMKGGSSSTKYSSTRLE